jgi:hypothetical protein
VPLTTRPRRWPAVIGALLLLAASAAAQTSGVVAPLGQVRTVDGRVARPGADHALVPLARWFVVLHRVGQDHAGPIDSVRTDAAGQYHFTYNTSGAPDAVYFASTRFAGIAYFTAPLQAPQVSGADADITVFDTTSTGITLHVEGRHVVVSAPAADGVRTVAEVFDLGNDGDKTLIAHDSVTPLWTATLPTAAVAPAVDGGDVAPGAVSFDDHEIRMFAPVSPGVRQLAVSYGLPAAAFPLRMPLPDGAAALEVLVEESTATPVLDGLAQQASVTSQGRSFKRYLARNVPPGAVLRINVSTLSDAGRTRFVAAVVLAMAAIMLTALVAALRRRRGLAPVGASSSPIAAVPPVLIGATRVEQVRFELACLDGGLAGGRSADGDGAARVRAARAALEQRLANALAEERRAP